MLITVVTSVTLFSSTGHVFVGFLWLVALVESVKQSV